MQTVYDALESAISCPQFEGVCKGFCRFDPAVGLIPRGYGGKPEDASDVRLIIVTAEPGDPAIGESYSGTALEMRKAHLNHFEQAMCHGIQRYGSASSQFHQRLCEILELFWPALDLDAQLKVTWFTDAVLCSASKSGGMFPKEIEMTCATTYLRPQIQSMQNAAVLALGAKAIRRMKQAGLRVDLTGHHPSVWPGRQLVAARESWSRAAMDFHVRYKK